MDINKEREAFENWAKNNGYHVSKNPVSGIYLSLVCNDAWKAWQAAKADAEREFNNFLFEYKKTLRKTYEDDEDNIHDYWRGFANCAKASEIVLNEMIEAAQEQS